MNEDHARVAIPARYALNTAIRRMRAIWDEGRHDYWSGEIASMVGRRKVTGEGIRTAIGMIDRDIVVSSAIREGTRLGKPSLTVDMIRMQPVTLVPRDDATRTDREIILLRRDVISQRGQEVDIRSGPLGIALDRHAAERIYERERCTHDEIVQRLRDDLAGLVRTVAFCRAAGVVKRLEGRSASDPLAAGEAALVPMGAGALVVEATRVDTYAGIARRTLARLPASKVTNAAVDPLVMVDAAPIEGSPAVGVMQMVGVTYLSDDLLRPEQRDCLALLEDAMEAAGHLVDEAAAALGTISMPHEPPVVLPAMPPVEPRLMALLARNVRRNRSPAIWTGNVPPRRRRTGG